MNVINYVAIVSLGFLFWIASTLNSATWNVLLVGLGTSASVIVLELASARSNNDSSINEVKWDVLLSRAAITGSVTIAILYRLLVS